MEAQKPVLALNVPKSATNILLMAGLIIYIIFFLVVK